VRSLGGGVPVGEDVDEQRVWPERVGCDSHALAGRIDRGDGLRDVVLDVVPGGEQQRHDDGGRTAVGDTTGNRATGNRVPHGPGQDVTDLRLLDVHERLAHVELGPCGTHAVEQRAHGRLARWIIRPVGRPDQYRTHRLSHRSTGCPPQGVREVGQLHCCIPGFGRLHRDRSFDGPISRQPTELTGR
jgi:hypothetical protein